MSKEIVVHETPVWRDRADFILGARIDTPHPGDGTPGPAWEQLWARRLGDDRFLLCCIPFFLYNLSLGDEIRTRPAEGRRFVFHRVLSPSGHFTFRVWFFEPLARHELPQLVASLGCLMEWRGSSSNLLAIDAPSAERAQELADLLYQREHLGQLEYETGLITQ